jgi:protein phosphatase PTC7
MDEASQADLFETSLKDGDIIIAFTDGFGDNVFMAEVEVLLEKLRQQKEYNVGDGYEQLYADKIADSLVSYARLCSERKDKQSPFELEAKRNKLVYKGGKVDDICVAVALVKQVN